MKSGDVSRLRSLEATAGAGAILVAALVTNSGLEQAFGRTPHSLSWGPGLFRILLALHGCVLLCGAGLSLRRALARHSGDETKVPRWRKPAPEALWVLASLTLLATL